MILMLKKSMTFSAFSILATILASNCLLLPAQAAAPNTAKEQGIGSYKAGKFADSSRQLELFLKANPNDANAHYYLAMAYQKLNQKAKAQWNYEWVQRNSKDAPLRISATKGLESVLGKNSSGKTASATSASPNSSSTSTGKPAIYDFGAVWCVPCKKFAPVFDRISEKYKGKINFVHIDIEDVKNKKMVDQFNVSIVPTLVFSDAAGQPAFVHQGVLTEAEVIQHADDLIK